MNPGQGPPGLGDPGSLFLEGQDQQHGEGRCLVRVGAGAWFCWGWVEAGGPAVISPPPSRP